ncbi:hypothetical protein PAPYR_3249 [Paratrimastix pyriformis]|uniref:CBM20 domain-containing protein n=1 Tax=Paratrimastix pyriformis TaxID=342808 RepID=A0ABQ8URA9_9EUKA|nr:hypothetical protein PAPYR_3249 [Paratrimastix pyriformis]
MATTPQIPPRGRVHEVRIYFQLKCAGTVSGEDIILMSSLPTCNWTLAGSTQFYTDHRWFPLWHAFVIVPVAPDQEYIQFDYKFAISDHQKTRILRWEGFPENRSLKMHIRGCLEHPQLQPVPALAEMAVLQECAAPSLQPSSLPPSPMLSSQLADEEPPFAFWMDCGIYGTNFHRILLLRDSAEPVPFSSFRSYTVLPPRNSDPDFVGVNDLKRQLQSQLRPQGQFQGPTSHQPPATPLPSPPNGYRFFFAERDELIKDPLYMARYRRAVELCCLSWGWSLRTDAPVGRPTEGQRWWGWDIRLRKMGQSLLLLGQKDLFEKVQLMVDDLRTQGVTFDERTPNPEDDFPFRLLEAA